MLCSPEDAEKTLLVLNCRKDLSLILLDHFLGAFSIFIFASVVSDLLKWYFRLVRKRCLPAKKEPEDSLLSNRFHAPILNSKQKYRGTGRVVLPRLLFAQIRREGRRDTDSWRQKEKGKKKFIINGDFLLSQEFFVSVQLLQVGDLFRV